MRLRASRPRPERIRPTKVGVWYIVCAILVGVAATNTGNNALYLVLAVMLGLLVVSGVTSRFNLRGLVFRLEPPQEVYANRPFHVKVSLQTPRSWLPRWLLVLALGGEGQPLLVPYLPRAGKSRGFVEMLLSSRGRHRLRWLHVGSVFPFGFFHKGMRYPVDVEILVYPEIYPAASSPPPAAGDQGEGSTRRSGWGYELHSLRLFRHGDDPRGIHWKQTARTGRVIYMEREADEGRRLSILLDNAVGEPVTDSARQRFERLVSEAATAAVDTLTRGEEVELVTRDRRLPFASGRLQRHRILEHLALIEPRPATDEPLRSSRPRTAELRLGMESVA